MGPRVNLFHMDPNTPGLLYESCRLARRAMLSSSVGRLRASRFAKRVADERRRCVGEPELEVNEESDALRSASDLGPSGMAVDVSPKTLCVWLEYF